MFNIMFDSDIWNKWWKTSLLCTHISNGPEHAIDLLTGEGEDILRETRTHPQSQA